mgnify:CR=1 FL=1
MGKFIDITGQKFNRLTAISIYGKNADNRITWLCKCDCGNEVVVAGKQLRSGQTKSCGCYNKELTTIRNTKHGKRYTRLYRIWLLMKNRCNNPKDKYYYCYGGKGVKVCDEWTNNFESFYEWSIASGYNDKLSIDRIDSDKGYQPDNCRWTTNKEQQNNKTNNHYITYKGKTQSMKKWSEELKIDYSTLRNRINVYQWDIETALTAPTGYRYKKNKGR